MNITSSSNDFMAELGMTLILHRSLAVLGIDGYTVLKIFARYGQQPYTKNDWGRGTQSRSTGSSRMCQQLMGNMKAWQFQLLGRSGLCWYDQGTQIKCHFSVFIGGQTLGNV